jgi:autotransporter-associated beta strand protein
MIGAAVIFNAGTLWGNSATWTGGSSTSNNWNDTANWSGGVQPTGGGANSTIHYTQGGRTTSNNDYGDDSQFQQILFDNTITSSSYTLTGSRIKLFDVSGDGITGKIENNSSILQTISFNGASGFSLLLESSFEIDPTQGDLTINNGVLLDFNTPTLNVFGNNGHVLTFNGAITQNSTGSFSLNDNDIVIFNGSNNYSGNTTIKAGELRFGQNGSSNNSTILLGNTIGTAASATVTMLGSAQTLSSPMTVQSGNGGEAVLRSQNSNGTTNNWNGTITLNKDLTVATTNSGATLNTAQMLSGTPGTARTISVGSASTTNNGTVAFTGSADNTDIAATVNSGALLLNKTSSSGVHSVGSGLTVNNGGTALLGNSSGDQIFVNSFVTINSGGTFKTQGFSEGSSASGATRGVGALTLQGGATIDFATGANGSTLSAASGVVSGAGTISIKNWTGISSTDNGSATNDRLLFQTDPNFSALQLAQFQFYDDSGTAFNMGAIEIAFNGWTEIVPVPEPGTWIGAALLLGSLFVSQRRRLFRLLCQ